MPSRNLIRKDVEGGYYHVYSRGINRLEVSRSEEDKEYFLYLLSRHLSIKPVVTRNGYRYPHYRGRIELIAFCIMDNHFHLLMHQVERGVLSGLMQSVLNAYSAYYRKKFGWRGPLFESRYKASIITDDTYLMHISRYIHLNPRSWKRYAFSSLRHIEFGSEPEWLQSEKLLELHTNRRSYKKFVADYEEHKKVLAKVKREIADL